jgi:hypothetical protein
MEPGYLVAGRYRLEEELGQGGMGAVWRAVDQELGREVALKRAFGGSVRREAKVGAGLMHPNVVVVFDAVTDEDAQWLVTEYVPATDLDRIIEAEGPLSEERALKIGGQLAAALSAIHRRGIVHRDIKPANVLVTADDVAKLTDLGIARWTEITQSGGAQLTGTLGYVAPEVANGGEATAASDMFALGATLYAAVEGQSPWGDGADGPFSQIQRAGKGTPIPYQRAKEIAPLLDALMERNPANRPTAADVTQYGDLPRLQGIRRRRRLRVRQSAILAGVGVLAVSAVLLAWFLPDRSAPDAAKPDVIGLGPDPAAVDPCAAISTNALRFYGQPFVDPEVLNFSSCVVTTELKDGSGQVQTVLELARRDPYPSRQIVEGEMGEMERPDISDGQCERSISLPDTNRIIATSHSNERAEDAPICAFAESVLTDAVALVNKGPLPQRSWTWPADSLARVDACTLLEATAVSKALGAPDDQPRQELGGWECTWEGKGNQNDLKVSYTREWPMETDDELTVPRTSIGGRSAFVIPETGNKAVCKVMVVHRHYKPRLPVLEGTEEMRDEVVTIRLIDRTSDSSAATCARTRAAAEAVVRSLPKAG